jgi:putative endonuclease
MSQNRENSGSWYVYILRCSDNTLYTGITIDPARRLKEHNEDDKLGARYTRARRPVDLIYQESCANRSAAARREAAIRKMSRKEKLHLIQNSK